MLDQIIDPWNFKTNIKAQKGNILKPTYEDTAKDFGIHLKI